MCAAQATTVLKQFAATPSPPDNDYEPLFDSIVNSIHEDRVYLTQKQKHMLSANGVMPSEYNGGFPGSVALHNYVDSRIQHCQAFLEAHGTRPADDKRSVRLMSLEMY